MIPVEGKDYFACTLKCSMPGDPLPACLSRHATPGVNLHGHPGDALQPWSRYVDQAKRIHQLPDGGSSASRFDPPYYSPTNAWAIGVRRAGSVAGPKNFLAAREKLD